MFQYSLWMPETSDSMEHYIYNVFLLYRHTYDRGFLGSSAGKESACNARDPSSIPGSGSSPGEGIGYPLQYSWVSLVAQMVKNLPVMRRPGFDPWVGGSPGGEGMATDSSILAWRISRDREAWWCMVHGVTKSRT